MHHFARLKRCFYLCMLVFLSACAGAGSSTMNQNPVVTTLVSNANCGSMEKEASLSIIPSMDALATQAALLGSLERSSHGENMDAVFEKDLVLQINMGMKPTGGYRLGLTNNGRVDEDSWLVLSIVWGVPAKGTMLTQVITSPCLLLATPRQAYKGIRVLDQTGKTRLQLSL